MISPADVPLVDSLPAQIASRYVKHEYPDHWFSFNDQIFTALWCNGLNISDTEILCDLAVKCGLNKDAVKTPLREVDAREQLLAQCAEARNAGIDDVPTLIYGNRSLHEVVSANKLTEFIHDDS